MGEGSEYVVPLLSICVSLSPLLLLSETCYVVRRMVYAPCFHLFPCRTLLYIRYKHEHYGVLISAPEQLGAGRAATRFSLDSLQRTIQVLAF